MPLTDLQVQALTNQALSLRSADSVPSDLAMVASPQPPDAPPATLLIAVSYGSCGDTLGRARLVGDTLVVEKRPPPESGSGTCPDRIELAGLLVTVPRGATVKAARLEPTRTTG